MKHILIFDTKWLKRLFTSTSQEKLISTIGDLRLQVELSNLQICRLAHKIKDLREAVDCLVPDEQKEKHTDKGRCMGDSDSSHAGSHACMRGDIPMDGRDC